MGALFVFIPVFIGIVFVLVIGTILFSATKGLADLSSNNARPRETIQVRVATKRQHVSGGGEYSARTEYFATFESLFNGERQEFKVNSATYGAIADGDTGQLIRQGKRFISFVRERNVIPTPFSPAPPVLATPVRCRYCENAFEAGKTKCPTCGASVC